MKLSKTFMHRSPGISTGGGGSNLELGGHCFIWMICRQFSCRRSWLTRHVLWPEPHASHWICRSVWQQSAAVFNKFRKHKLIKQLQLFFEYSVPD